MSRFSFLTSVALLALAALPVGGCSCGSKNKACEKNTDCKPGQMCVPTLIAGTSTKGPNMCVTGAQCGADSDCTAMDQRKICDIKTHQCIFRNGFGDECSETMPCAFGQFCSTLIGKCFDASKSRDCTRRAQCPSGQMCDLAANKCVPDLGCFGDNFCETGEKCDLVNHVCVTNAVDCATCFATACTNASQVCSDDKECLAPGQMPACHTGEKCDPLGRCVQCLTTAECGAGLFCNMSTGQCESNVQCADDPSMCPAGADVHCITCTPPQICDQRTKMCSAPPTTCAANVDCPGDQYCNTNLDPPVCVPRIPDCINDHYDQTASNDTAATASFLDPMLGPIYDDLKLCPSDIDWFKIKVQSGTFLTVDARFRNADGDIDLDLYLEDGTTVVASSHSQQDYERVLIDAGVDMTLLLRVYLARPSVNPVPYKLIVTREAGDSCMEDAFDPNQTLSAAKVISSDVPVEGRLCSASPDWFVLRAVPPMTRIDAQLGFVSSLGNLDLELYRADSPVPILASATNSDLEEIIYDASFMGDYYLRVVGRGADQNVYTLRVTLRANPQATCADDRFEPNNSPAMATDAVPLLMGVQSGLTICAGDEDWFTMQLGPGEAITAEIGFHLPADLDLGLFPGGTTDPHVVPLRESTGSSMREFAAYRTMTAGTFLARVFGHSAADSSAYDLRITRVPPFICHPDGHNNHSMTTALLVPVPPATVPPTRVDGLTLCANEGDDWYKLTLLAGFENFIRIQYIASDAVLDMAIVDPTGAQLAVTGGTSTDYKEIGATLPGAGTTQFFLRVFKTAGAETAYNLTMDIVPIFTCLPDIGEPDDTVRQASMIAASTTTVDLHGLTMCASTINPVTMMGDQDYYVLRPPRAGVRIDASITFPQGDLLMELLSPGGAVRACQNEGMDRCYSDGETLSEHISFTATVAGTSTRTYYYLRVSSIYSSPQVLTRPPDADTRYDLHISYTQ
jgi:hypothetical protein